jgi:hypothetical protein
VQRALDGDRGLRHPHGVDVLGRLQPDAGVLGLAAVGREVRPGGVDLLEQRLRRQADREVAGRLDVGHRVLAADRGEPDDGRGTTTELRTR